MQRVRVGMTGLASVLILIGLASAVFNSASKEPAVAAVGTAKPAIVANMTDMADGNSTAEEPLAELGLAPKAEVDNASGAN